MHLRKKKTVKNFETLYYAERRNYCPYLNQYLIIVKPFTEIFRTKSRAMKSFFFFKALKRSMCIV